ncbi:hypothetical protein CHLNCDRAFT_143130 [Chlorella variabilis]|uniref:Uncharacterized protein n=1 Tax=Chlorella variabilis TaxID=554065 RepID=E1Z9I9_CHLVA|nr:hypothetical protein CHLNCDRAFT_143130 [Chlorella variabilis]EFN57785.1 hypothetical protein CHLNCDRAFT_143130 [Chlorella variabilis]|eukprot:XP_005849887.1 hypothetical protein CHLNCDRAFT_143130 [Chlorella variabilis]
MGAEAFGNVVGALKSSKKQGQLRQQEASKLDGPSLAEQQAGAALKREQALALIREDFIQNYFVTGQGALAAYDPDCLFADPFASFNGTARFKRNVSNLGGLLTDIDLTLTDWQEGEDELRTKWRFSATLSGLPWKPLLAAAGGTTFATGRVCKHIESWDIEPARVLRQLLKPSAKVPATQAEVLMSGVYDGDITGIWYAVSSKVVAVAGPASALLAMLHLARGEGAGWLEGGMYLAFLAAVVTELGKIIGNVTGGGG